MPILRCNQCDHIREVSREYLGKRVKCPACGNSTPIYDTATYISALFNKYQEQKKTLESLRSGGADNSVRTRIESDTDDAIFDDVDLHNTNLLAHANNLDPLTQWFAKRQIEVEFNPDAADTSGFFDEIALKLGNDFEVLSYVTNQIKYLQSNGHRSLKMDVSNKSAQEIQIINDFCRDLYEYSFVSKHIYIKKDNLIQIILQPAAAIKRFFAGIWMEWFALMKVLHLFKEKQLSPACSRSLKVTFQGDKSNELDIFILSNDGVPVCIECKSGEFRHDIEKYEALRKQLGLTKSQFIVCVFGLSDEQVVGLTSMYGLTFTNQSLLVSCVEDALK